MFSFEDPMDISVFVLTLLLKCYVKDLKMAAHMIRAIAGFCFTFAEGFIVIYDLLSKEENSLVITLACAGIFVVFLAILIVLGIIAIRDVGYQKVGIFFFVFKIMNLFMALIIGAGIIIGKEQLGFSKWYHIALVVCLGVDIAFDPIELIIACCCLCGGGD